MFQWTSLDHVGLRRVLRQGDARVGALAVRLLPHQLDQRRPGRQPADLRAQHVGGLRPRPAQRADPLAPGRQALELSHGRRARAPPTSTIRASWPTARSASSTTAPRRPCTASRAASSSSLDAQQRTATLQTQIVHTPPLLAASQGNLQALANGDWFVGWGQDPGHVRVRRRRERCCSTRTSPRTRSPIATCASPGRARRRTRPRSWCARRRGGAATVYASWNGATQVAAWRVLAGAGASGLQPVAQVRAQRLRDGDRAGARRRRRPYVTVQALDAAGQVLATAPVAKA